MPRPGTGLGIDGIAETVRGVSELAMVDEVKHTRTTGRGVYDPDTMRHDHADVIVYTGRARVYPVPRRDAKVMVHGERPVTVHEFYEILPAAVTDVQIEDLVEVLVARTDPGLTGRTFRVTEVHAATVTDGRKVALEALT